MPARAAALGFVCIAMVAGIVACGGSSGSLPALPMAPNGVAAGTKNPIRHVVIVIQENRSFDNFFATFPGADGTKVGSAKPMPSPIAKACRDAGMPVVAQPTTVPLKEVSLIGGGFPGNFGEGADLDHIHSGYKLELDEDKMDGFDVSKFGPNGEGTPTCTYTYQYVNPSQIQPYWDLAKQYVLADHTFQTQGSSSFTAHQDLIAGGTKISANEAIIDNPSFFPWGCDANKSVVTAIIKKSDGKVYPYGGPFPCFTYATLRDLLDAKSVSWKYYAVPVQKESGCQHGNTAGIWNAFDAIKAVRYSAEWRTNVPHSNLVFFTDVSKHQLPAVSWITPNGVNSDHPGTRKHPPCESGGPLEDNGPSWVASIVNAIGKSSYWNSTAIVILWDDWGGYYDHAVPPQPRTWEGGPGFRVPMLIVAPYVKPHVEHTMYQFGSILRFIEETWNLGSLGNNDAKSNSIGSAFDFGMQPRRFKQISSKYSSVYFLHQPPSGDPPDTE
jgi:phospholipase C